MHNLTQLFKLLEITRAQPQYGYALAGVSKSELSDLAQHQYLVAMIGLQLAHYLNSKGAKLNIQSVLEISLTHDLGELFGGDVNYFYSRANPVAREKAKSFEAENLKYLAKVFGTYGERLLEHTKSFEEKNSDEAVVAQCADKIECVHYKLQVGKFSSEDVAGTKQSLLSYCVRAKDAALKAELEKFVETWAIQLPGKSVIESMAEDVKEYN